MGDCCQGSYCCLEVSKHPEVSATGQLAFVLFFLGPRANAELVTKIGVALYASIASTDYFPNLRQHAILPRDQNCVYMLAHHMQNSAQTLSLFLLLHHPNSPLTITLSSSLPNVLP